ncbi:Cell adhesion molecule 3 [Scophthalmus maximus]|uniref:Cell adhesion molecule 3 n=1 Tax=Scophthalmus maximus TaxID=52904 RepID=A0A2U9B624_SCOMX|nr:Cell adhesion molecule 3 [Scophthalmus maximus]
MTLALSDMGDYLLGAIVIWLCFLPAGLRAEECSQAVLARRGTSYVQEGGSLSLLCVVQHCGDAWTGDWMKKNSTDAKFSTVKNSDDGPHLTSVPLSENETHLVLSFPRVNRLDEGSYGCRVTWGQGITDMGHLMYVNVTAAVPSQRKWWHRVLVYAGASLCLPVILGVARCLSSGARPRPFPRTQSTRVPCTRVPPPPPVRKKRGTHSHKAPPKSQQQNDVVYADISNDALGQQRAARDPPQSTVYSTVKFS